MANLDKVAATTSPAVKAFVSPPADHAGGSTNDRSWFNDRGLSLPIGKEGVGKVLRLAKWLDAAFRIPGTRIRFGWDPIIGLLLPVVGDAATVPLKLAPVGIAWKLGASRWLIAKMLLNIAIDSTIGAIPILGDIFDFFFKANLRNARLLATLTDDDNSDRQD